MCLLKRSIYGLKQSPRKWYTRFDEFILKVNFTRYKHDSCVYIKKDSKVITYLLLYVDDMLVASYSKTKIQIIKDVLNKEFEMKDMESAKRILGM